MALGDLNNTNTNNNNRRDIVYSKIQLYSDKASLSFEYVLDGILKLKMTPRNENGQGFDDKNSLAFFFSVQTAYNLLEGLKLLAADIRKGVVSNYGVCNYTKTASIHFSYKQMPNNRFCITAIIYKWDKSGNISEQYEFVSDTSNNYIIKDFSPNDNNFDYIYLDEQPLKLIAIQLDEYIKSMTNANAYSTHHAVGEYFYKNRYSNNDQKQLQEPQVNNSVFNNNPAQTKQFTSGNVEDLFDEFD